MQLIISKEYEECLIFGEGHSFSDHLVELVQGEVTRDQESMIKIIVWGGTSFAPDLAALRSLIQIFQ